MKFSDFGLSPNISYIMGLVFLLILIAILYSLQFHYIETFTADNGCQVMGSYTIEKCGHDVKISTNVISDNTMASHDKASHDKASHSVATSTSPSVLPSPLPSSVSAPSVHVPPPVTP